MCVCAREKLQEEVSSELEQRRSVGRWGKVGERGMEGRGRTGGEDDLKKMGVSHMY